MSGMETSDEFMEQILARVDEDRKAGVSCRFDRNERGISRKPLRVTHIFWEPGDPNPLARMIIGRVGDSEVILSLDGHEFLIRRVN